jgi:hypothetical protein
VIEAIEAGVIVVADSKTVMPAHKFFPMLIRFESESSCRIQAAMDWAAEEDDENPLNEELGLFALIQKVKREHANLISIFTKGYSLN